jgi:hypothetical protein
MGHSVFLCESRSASRLARSPSKLILCQHRRSGAQNSMKFRGLAISMGITSRVIVTTSIYTPPPPVPGLSTQRIAGSPHRIVAG